MFAEADLFIHFGSIMKKMRKIMDQELYLLGISHTEMRVLMMVYHSNGCSQEELASHMEVDRSNVGRSLKKLENMNYITRVKDKEDARAYRVFLTDAGWNIKDKIFEIKDNLRKTFTVGATAEELNTLASLLEKVDRSLSEENYFKFKNMDSK